jgi:hypothetical protein
MQPVAAHENRAQSLPGNGLQSETEELETLHAAWRQQVAAWRLAHEAALLNTARILARTDELIARFEAL